MSQQIVWITGASQGIGRALALRLAQAGAKVAASARSAEDLAALTAAGPAGAIHPYPLDVTDGVAVQNVLTRIEAELGPLDLAILNAGTHQPVDAANFQAAGFAKLVTVNLLGTANCLEPVLQRMLTRGRGHIALVASVAGYRGLPTSAYYGATKAALINLAEALKFDLDKAGIKLQLINPGFVKTPLTDRNPFPMPFMISAEEAARRIAAGLQGSAFEITFPKRFTYVLKVLRCLPYRLYFPLVARQTKA